MVALEKECKCCGLVKSLEEYHADRRLKDGRRYHCKTCVAIQKIGKYVPKSRTYPTPPTKPCMVCGIVFRTKSGEMAKRKFCSKACMGVSLQQNRSRPSKSCAVCGQVFERKQSRLDKSLYCSRECQHKASATRFGKESNPNYKDGRTFCEGYRRACNHRWRAAVKSGGGNYTPEQWKALCASFGNKCLACGSTNSLTVDHIVPVSKGGSSDISNLQCLCKSCNSRKKDRVIDYRPLN